MDGQRSELDTDGLESRMDAIRLKQLLAPETLSERELMCLQIEQHGFGCSSKPGHRTQ
jgi:hypothetical protein